MAPNWKVFALASAAFAALTAIFGKIGVAQMNSNLATFFRTIVILVMSALVVTLRHEWRPYGALSAAGMIALGLSGLATGLSWLCYYRALQLGPASLVAPLDKLSVVLVVLFGVLFLNEPLTWKVGLGAALVSVGAIIMAT